MQKLRAILNAALTRKALCVRLSSQNQPKYVFADQVVESDPQTMLSAEELDQIFAMIMPGQSFGDKPLLTGSLNVGAQGVLKLRAFSNPLRIDIFTPAGLSLFDQMVTPMEDSKPALPQVAPLPVASVPVPPPPAPVNSVPPPVPLAATVPPPPAPQVPPLASIPTEAPSQAASTAPSAPAPAVPLFSAGTPQPLPVTEPKAEALKVETPKSEVSGDAKSASTPAAPDLGGMFRKAPPTGKKADNQPAKAKPMASEETPSLKTVSPASPVQPAPSMVVASPAVSPTPEPKVEEINFGNKDASEGSVSQGQNPIDGLLREMVKMKASDMHLTVGQPVIYRVHGDIARVSQDPISPDMMRQLLLPTMPKRNHDEFSRSQDTDYAYELANIGRFRVNVFRDRNGVGAVMRHIPSQILTAEQLGLAPAITKLCTLNKGLVLVTGPTGSGKSTTLAAMLDLINKTRKEHILTIEDPIEFVHPQQLCLVNQREVHKHTGSFGRALKAALREDPDIVLIGEMRDLETIAIAIETAETGHLVFGTLHTTTAMSTVDRIIDQFPADRQSQIRVMLASSLRGVVAQTLLKKKSGGRVAAHEILIANDAVSAMIREGKVQHLANHMLTQKQDGNQLLNDSLLKLVQDGLVDVQDAFFKAVDKNGFLTMAKQRGINVNLNSAA
jgi:twitching motility protein PilT